MNNIKVFLFSSPNDSKDVLKITRNCTFFNYFIDKSGQLNKKAAPYGSVSSLMYLSDFGIEDFDKLDCYKISREIAAE